MNNPSLKQMTNMPLHKVFNVNTIKVWRVPGGFIYNMPGGPCFIEEPLALKIDKPKALPMDEGFCLDLAIRKASDEGVNLGERSVEERKQFIKIAKSWLEAIDELLTQGADD